MAFEEMPREGVKKMMESPSGRRYLTKLAERYKGDILQPGQKGFDHMYGNKLKKDEENRRKNESMAKAEWEKKNWEKIRNNTPVGHRTKYF